MENYWKKGEVRECVVKVRAIDLRPLKRGGENPRGIVTTRAGNEFLARAEIMDRFKTKGTFVVGMRYLGTPNGRSSTYVAEYVKENIAFM